MTPQEYLRIEKEQRAIIQAAEQAISWARDKADKCPWPKSVRPCEAYDIKPGAIIWRKSKDYDGEEFHYWNIVDEPRHYGDAFKAYVADDGCRYGLEGAYIDTDPPSEFPVIKALKKVL